MRNALELWLQSLHARGASALTIDNYRRQVGRFIDYLNAQSVHDMDDVEPRHIEAWLSSRREAGVSRDTLRNAYRNPRAWWNWCLRNGLVEHNPFAKIPAPRPSEKVKPALSDEQVDAILKVCNGKDWRDLRNRALVLVLLSTGMRLSECHRLTVADATRECIIIRGKGSKERPVYLTPEVQVAIRRYLKACPFPLRPTDALWQGESGALSIEGVKFILKSLGKKAGVYPLGAHAFRRSFAIGCLRNGLDLERLRLLLGHSSYQVVRQYLHVLESDLREAHRQYNPLNQLSPPNRPIPDAHRLESLRDHPELYQSVLQELHAGSATVARAIKRARAKHQERLLEPYKPLPKPDTCPHPPQSSR